MSENVRELTYFSGIGKARRLKPPRRNKRRKRNDEKIKAV
jgi:hypothetical protein